MPPFVAVVVSTYRRPEKIRALLESLEACTVPIGVVITDNSNDIETKEAAARCIAFEAVHLFAGSNLGCGGGLAYAQKQAIACWGDKVTHLVACDDDVEVEPDTFAHLIEALEKEEAIIACPFVIGPEGEFGWYPGFLDEGPFNYIRGDNPSSRLSRQKFISLFGTSPRPVSWATGVTLMVKRSAFEKLGAYATNFWIRGEDLEYSLRFTASGKGVFVPKAVVHHLPPPANSSLEGRLSERSKHLAMVQNCTYLSLHPPHGRRILKHLPGNIYRTYKTWGARVLPKLLVAVVRGLLKKPAGTTAPL